MGKERQLKRLRREVRRQQEIWAKNQIKPKAKFVPTFIWMWLLKFFLKIEK